MGYTSKLTLQNMNFLSFFSELWPKPVLKMSLNYIFGSLVPAMNSQSAVFPFASVKRQRYPPFCKFDGSA